MLVIIDCSSRAIFGKVSEAYGIRKTIFPKIIITVRIFFFEGRTSKLRYIFNEMIKLKHFLP